MEKKPRSCTLIAWALLIVPAAAACAAEPGYPARPIRIIVPQSPGASTDLTARLVAQKLNEAFKQPVIVDNRPGASGIAGTEIVARAAPDGYTLMVVASSFSINPALGRRLNAPDVLEVFERDGADVVGNAPEQFGAILKAEIEKWTKVAKAAGIKLE